MKLETLKTIILLVLVGLSLILTFSLWNFQPNITYLSSDRPEYVNEVDIGGTEEMKKTIIEPSQIIFHKNDKYYGFTDPIRSEKLYKKMQEWILDDYRIGAVDESPVSKNLVEVIFPTALPMDIVKSLFTLNEIDELPSWTFKKMFITFNEVFLTLKLNFVSTDNTQKVEYVIKDPSAYNYLRTYINFGSELSEYTLFDEGIESIYLPNEPLEIKNRSFTVQTINSYLLVNALFSNPSNVSPNIGEAYFTDGQRGMRILNEERSMEFIHPIHSNGEIMNPLSLLDRSLAKINEHKGWTNKFLLENINTYNNELQFRMYYDGYPVFGITRDYDIAVIEQKFLNQELHLYRRPLFKLDNLLGGDNVRLPSGKELIKFLKMNDYYDLSKVSNIQVGFKLAYFDGTAYSITLDPAWFLQYKGNWIEIRIDDYDYFKGVS